MSRTVAVIAGGAIFSLLLLMVAFRISPDLSDVDVLLIVSARLLFNLGAVALTSFLLTILGRAGSSHWVGPRFILPLLGAMIAAGIGMAADPSWDEMLARGQWLDCLVAVPIMIIVPFVIMMLTVRMVAQPIHFVDAGAIMGLIAASVSVIAYSLHCTVNPAPLVAVWFGATSILAMLAGAKLEARLLRVQLNKRPSAIENQI